MPARPLPPLLSVLAMVAMLASACAAPLLADTRADAGATVAPAADARLADVRYPQVAAWIRDEQERTGRPVVVKFFASWCGPCAEEAPVLLRAARRHPDVAVLGIDHQDLPSKAEAWIDEHGFDAIPTLADVEGETARRFGARGMPSVSFVDGSGHVVHTHTGPIDDDLLEAWIAHLVDGGPRPAARPDAPSTDAP